MELILDGHLIKDKKSLFQTLKSQINSEEFYGNNLDALWDILSSYQGEIRITVRNVDKLRNNLGEYADSLLELFKDLKEINCGIAIQVN